MSDDGRDHRVVRAPDLVGDTSHHQHLGFKGLSALSVSPVWLASGGRGD